MNLGREFRLAFSLPNPKRVETIPTRGTMCLGTTTVRKSLSVTRVSLRVLRPSALQTPASISQTAGVPTFSRVTTLPRNAQSRRGYLSIKCPMSRAQTRRYRIDTPGRRSPILSARSEAESEPTEPTLLYMTSLPNLAIRNA